MANHYIQANTDGRLHAASEASISPLNRGFLYGDAIYEVWRTYRGVIFAWEEHWRRLFASAVALHFKLAIDPPQILSEIRRTVAAYRERVPEKSELYIRLQITRGMGAIGLDVALAENQAYVILVQPCPVLSEEVLRTGLRLSIATSLRRNPVQSLDPAWKTGNYLNNLLCLREAKERGADDVVMLNLAGELTESAVSNIGFIRSGRLLTPPLASGILGGITRGLVLSGIAKSAGLSAFEQTVRPAELSSMDECFLLSTTKDVVPVRSIDENSFRVGPDTATRRLRDAFGDAARSYASEHRELGL